MATEATAWNGKCMCAWDMIRRQVETRKGSDLPRMNFESIMEDFADMLIEAADALDAEGRAV